TKVTLERAADDIYTAEEQSRKFAGFVRVDMSLGGLYRKKATALWQNLALIPVYLIIGIMFSIVVERQISKPLKNLKTAAVSVAHGDFTKKIDVATHDEIGALAETFNYMSNELSSTIGKLNYSNEKLGKINKELHDFTYIVSHDLQEPLRKVHSFGQFLVEDCYEQLSEDGKDYIERMQKASIKMKTLIQNLLELSRIGTTEASFVPIDTGKIIDSALDDLSIAISECNGEVVVSDLPAVIGHDTLLTQLFGNLIGNALKYRSDERPPRIEVSAKPSNGEMVFSIKDNGIGIKERFHDKIFGVFQRLHTTEYEGTGIGLALCKKIVDRHGGRIWIESVAGEGTTFHFTLKKANVTHGEPENG
ncbi:MAG: sensor histidine kinase, partial [Planctomycetota bacterium]